MPTKKIRLLDPQLTVTLVSGTKTILTAGRDYEIDAELARKMIEAGHAVEAVEEQERTEKPDENKDA